MMEKIILRPSSISTLVSCPKQWYEVFILGKKTIPNVRAAIGTGVHAGIEAMWIESMISRDKEKINKTMVHDAAVEAFDKEEEQADGQLSYDEGLNYDKAVETILDGVDAFINDIVPFTPIPNAVEKRFTVPLQHSMVESVSGTLDYLADNTIADIKTSKRAIVASSHVLQQSTYKLLAERNGVKVTRNIIQGVIFKAKETVGSSLELTPKVEQVKYIINNLLDRLDLLQKDTIDPEILFPGNPKHYLCSDKYCTLRPTCKFVQGA